MKTKIVVCVLVVTGIVLFGCASQSGSSGQITPSFDGFTPGEPAPTSLEYGGNAFQPQYNRDGSITVFTVGNVQIKILPMTNSRGSRGALTRTTDEFNTLIRQDRKSVV